MPVTHAYVPRGRSLTGQAQGGRLVGLLIDLQAVRTWTAPGPGLEPRQPRARVRAGGPGTLVPALLLSREALPTLASVSPSATRSAGETGVLPPGCGEL